MSCTLSSGNRRNGQLHAGIHLAKRAKALPGSILPAPERNSRPHSVALNSRLADCILDAQCNKNNICIFCLSRYKLRLPQELSIFKFLKKMGSSAAPGVEPADQAKKSPFIWGLELVPAPHKSTGLPLWTRVARPKSERQGQRESNRTRDLLITSLCNNRYKSETYAYHFHKNPQFHQCFEGFYS